MKVLKCGSQTNLLPPQVEQKQQSLMQIRLAVVFGRGECSVCVFVFKLEICSVQNSPYTFGVYLNTSVTPAPLPKEAPKPLNPPPLHTPPCHRYTHPLTCSKAAFPQAFPLKGQIFHLCNSVPYWFLGDCSHLMCSAGPKFLLGKCLVFTAKFIPVYSSERNQSDQINYLVLSVSCGAISICVCAFSISQSIYNYTTRAWLGGH